METLKTRIKTRILFNICNGSCWNLSNNKGDIQIIEAESFNWSSECDNCHKTIYWNHCVRNRKTKKHLPMDAGYHEGEQVIRHTHKTTIIYSDKILDVDKVDKRTLEIEHKRWLETIGYQPLNEWELEQVELGRKYHETFKVDKKK